MWPMEKMHPVVTPEVKMASSLTSGLNFKVKTLGKNYKVVKINGHQYALSIYPHT